jgi:hypothetical protein
MIGSGWRKRKWVVASLVLLLGAGAAAWAQRKPALAWYYVRALAGADETGREPWLNRLEGLGEDALPALLRCLARPEAGACANARAALARLADHWGVDDPRTASLASRLGQEFSRYNPVGRRQALELAADWFQRVGPGPQAEELVPAGRRLVTEAAASSDSEEQAAALDLAAALLARHRGGEAVASVRELTRACLSAEVPACRVRAVQLALLPEVQLLEEVVPLLNDSDAAVRRAAMLAVGTASQVILEDALLPSLHDPDAEVRGLCEKALLARGSTPEHIQLGRLLTDPQPLQRLEVLGPLARRSELDTGLWLRRLSYDPNPAVRVAALRAMSEQAPSDFKDRIDEMAQRDPSPTVCDVAKRYLKLSQRRYGTRAGR